MNVLTERFFLRATSLAFGLLLIAVGAVAQLPAQESEERSAGTAREKSAEPPNAAQIELLETKYRFETNGDSRKEVHALVKINSELGVRQFARLNFDYNRSFQSVEIPLVHITHANGGTSDILPSAITDGRVARRGPPSKWIALRWFDLDDIGTGVGEELAAVRSGDPGRALRQGDAGEHVRILAQADSLVPSCSSRWRAVECTGSLSNCGITCFPNVSTASSATSIGMVVESMPKTSWSAPTAS